MKLSTRGRYGVRALLELALQEGKSPVSLKDIAQRQGISLQYLEHLVTPLIAGGLVKSTRGAHGGISLAKSPSEIKLIDILRLLEGSTAPVECVEKPEVCIRSKRCATRDIWCEVNQAVTGILNDTTLQELVDRQKRKSEHEGSMYYI